MNSHVGFVRLVVGGKHGHLPQLMDEHLQVLSGLKHLFILLAAFQGLNKHGVLGLARLALLCILQTLHIQVSELLLARRLDMRLDLLCQINNQVVDLLMQLCFLLHY